MASSRSAPARRPTRCRAWRTALPRLWAWLTDTGYRPERRYMRGGRPPAAGPRP
jgi:hypothetical protein